MESGFDFSFSKILTESPLVPRAVLEISEAVSSTDNINELYAQIHKIINQYIPAPNFYIALYDSQSNTISYPYYVDEFESLPKEKDTPNSLNAVTTYALNQDNPLLITSKMLNDLIKSGELSYSSMNFREWLGVPLKTPDKKTIGLIAAQNRDETKSFNEEHKNFLTFVSAQIAVAIQQKTSTHKIRQNEQKFRTLYKKNPLMLFIIDQNGKVIDANDQTKLDLGYDAEELVSKDVDEVFHPDDRKQVRKNIADCIENKGTTHKWELRKICKNGDIIWVRESATVLEIEGESPKIIISCESINDIKYTQLKLKESEERYRQLTDSIGEMIMMHDKDGHILFVNEAGLSLTKYPKQKLLATNVFSIFEEEYTEGIIDFVSGNIKDNSLYFFKIELEDYQRNKIPLEINVTKVNAMGDGDNLLMVARDIRERINSEASISKYNEELKKSNYAKDRFFSIIAHDLRSPFNALLSYSDILIDEFEELERAEIKEYVGHINNVSHNLLTLLNNLLDWSRIQTNRYQIEGFMFNLRDSIQRVLSMSEGILKEKNLDVDINLAENCNVFGDENMIATVFRNLLSNAVKFSEDNSKISVTVQRDGDFARVIVEDNGVGMLKEDISKLFRIDINHTTLGTHKEKGTGLGLILAKEMIEKNGGKIEVESKLGEGSKFSFTVPTKGDMRL